MSHILPTTVYDAIVIGLGGIGSATLYSLSKTNQHILGIEQYKPLHAKGSSHGQSRIVRHGYFSNRETYMPLLLRSKTLWQQLEKESGNTICHNHAGLSLGDPTSTFMQGSLLCAKEYNLNIETLSAQEIKQLYPQFSPPKNFIATLDNSAYTLNPEQGIKSHLTVARNNGAETRYNEKVQHWRITADGNICIETNKSVYLARKVIFAAGPWTKTLLPNLPLHTERTISYWFRPTKKPELFSEDKLPNYIWYFDDENIFYGFPKLNDFENSIKVGLHFQRSTCNPNTINRDISSDEISVMQDFLKQYIPSLAGECVHAETCMYTMTPDENFIIGNMPDQPNIFVAAGFSGHGYRFASALGEALACLANDDTPSHSLKIFSPDRFTPKKTAI